jgi:hypothetical protein
MRGKQEIMKDTKGISGWLSPLGNFIYANYGEHDKVARELEEYNKINPIYDTLYNFNIVHGERLLETLGYIKFVCRWLGGSVRESYVFFPQIFGYRDDITDKQIKWMEENYENMSDFQKKYVNDYLYYTINNFNK